MKKEIKLKSVVVLLAVLVILCPVFVQAFSEPEIIKTNKARYNTGESVYVLSTVGGSDKLCRSNSDEEVKLYIVESKEEWSNGASFEDVREEPTLIKNSKFSNKRVWIGDKAGTYNLIVDCDDNQQYDEVNEPLFGAGFEVVPKKGSGRVFKGNSIKGFSWFFDAEEPDLEKEILRFNILAEDESIELSNLTVNSVFPKNSSFILEVYIDKNNNGMLNPVDVMIGSVEVNEVKEVIDLDYTLSMGSEEKIIFVFRMNGDYLTGDYKVKLVSIFGNGIATNERIPFLGVPFESNVMTVLDKKSCLGSLNLVLSSNSVQQGEVVIARFSNLTGCDNNKVFLRTSPCYDVPIKEVGFCVLSGGACKIDIEEAVGGSYYACSDKNQDKDFIDFGEFDVEELVVEVLEVVEEVVDEEIVDETEEDSVITGEVVNEEEANSGVGDLVSAGKIDIEASSTLIVLVEVTLLLILFVLILILFKLKGPNAPVENMDDEEKEEKDYEEKDN